MAQNLTGQSGQSAYLASRNESLGFAQRTLENLDYIEEAWKAGDLRAHVVTQRVVSLLGLVVFPWEQGFDDKIKTKRLDTLEQNGWPTWKILRGSTDTLGELVENLRHAVAHRRLHFSSDSPHPSEVDIEFANMKRGATEPHWRVQLSANHLDEFCRRFIGLVHDMVG